MFFILYGISILFSYLSYVVVKQEKEVENFEVSHIIHCLICNIASCFAVANLKTDLVSSILMIGVIAPLIFAVYVDIKKMILPDYTTLFSTIFAVMLINYNISKINTITAVITFIIWLIYLLLAVFLNAYGFGDIKILFPIAILTVYTNSGIAFLIWMAITTVAQYLYALLILKNPKIRLPYGPILVTSLILAIM